jgi:phenylacetate-coenzyme A ligase PaaK-like adenylate-forming protein
MDTAVYKEKIQHYWGKNALEMYGGSEFGLIALQTWDYEAMTFVPDLNFLEFIPEDEHLRSRQDPDYEPSTLLLDELEPGQVYEIVITNFDGGVFVRYRVGDMIRIVASRNEKLGIEIPQMVFETRCDDVIDLANFTRLTERSIWQALETAGVPYVDWTARREPVDQQYWLHVYVELKDGYKLDEAAIAANVHDQLRKLDPDYRDLEEMLGLRLIKATVLPSGAFDRFIAEQQAAGADPAHLKPPHMRASDEILAKLLRPGVTEPPQ